MAICDLLRFGFFVSVLDILLFFECSLIIRNGLIVVLIATRLVDVDGFVVCGSAPVREGFLRLFFVFLSRFCFWSKGYMQLWAKCSYQLGDQLFSSML
jgi:hypothetical protein